MFTSIHKFALGIFLVLLSACGEFHSVSQTEEATFIQFIGDPSDISLTLDDSTTVELASLKSFDLNGKNATKIITTPGQHRVSLRRGEILILDRKVYVGEGSSFDIALP